MRRFGPTFLVIVLLAATAAAFALAQRLKLEPSPITSTKVDKVFSPVCECPTDTALIGFRLREPGRVVVVVLDADRKIVRTLADRRAEAGDLRLRWDGRDDAGSLMPEGTYLPRVRLPDEQRTIVLPNPIRLDTTPPRMGEVTVEPRVFSPDGDGRNDRIEVRYAVSDRAHGLLLVNGRQMVRTRFQELSDTMPWFGRVNGRALRPGTYVLDVGAEDDAGNRAEPVSTTVTIRYIELARETLRVPARGRFGIGVETDARSFRWRFARATGTDEPGLLVMKRSRLGCGIRSCHART